MNNKTSTICFALAFFLIGGLAAQLITTTPTYAQQYTADSNYPFQLVKVRKSLTGYSYYIFNQADGVIYDAMDPYENHKGEREFQLSETIPPASPDSETYKIVSSNKGGGAYVLNTITGKTYYIINKGVGVVAMDTHNGQPQATHISNVVR